jgi:hypothetical protein
MRYLKDFKNIFESTIDFIYDSERKFKRLISDIDDILVVFSDDDIKYDVNKYIDDNIFELQIDIEIIKTKDEKQLVADTLLRLNDFLQSNDLYLQVIRMKQYIDNEYFEHELWSDDNILQEFEFSAGEISIEIVFGEHA